MRILNEKVKTETTTVYKKVFITSILLFLMQLQRIVQFFNKKKHLYNWPLFCRRTCTVRVTSRKNKEMKRRNIMGRQRDRGDSLFPLYSQTFLVQFFLKLGCDQLKVMFGWIRCGTLIDLCRGPHVRHTGKIKSMTITKVKMFIHQYWKSEHVNLPWES